MGRVLTTESRISCPSGGVVTKKPSSAKLTVANNAVVTKTLVDGQEIAGCTQAPPPAGATPCKLAAVTLGEATKLTVGGQPTLLEDTFAGTGTGAPLNKLSATAVQTKLRAT